MRVTARRRGYLKLALRTDEPCRATIRAKRFKTRHARLVPGRRTVIKLRRTKRGPRKVTVRIRALDAAGNATKTRRTIRTPRRYPSRG